MTEKENNNLIFIVEDSDEDYFVTVRAFKKAGLSNEVKRVKDGEAAINYLEDINSTKPSLMLLDLNLPKKGGREVLSHIKNQPALTKIPIIVLTTSSDKKDIDACYEMGANSYIQKPVDMYGFIDAIKMLKNYWFEIVILPSHDES